MKCFWLYWYSYCLNNPLVYTDPSGELSFLATLAIVWAGNYVIGWLDNVINKEMSPKDAFRNTSFVMGVNWAPADFNNKNYGVSHPQVDAHNEPKKEEETINKVNDELNNVRQEYGVVVEVASSQGGGTPWYSIYNWPALGSSARTMDALYAGNYLEAGIQFLTCAAEVFTCGMASEIKLGTKTIQLGYNATRAGTQYSDDLVRAAQQLYPGKAGKIQLHHITPKYLGGAKNGPLVPLDGAYHQQITNAFRKAWPYGQGHPSATQLRQIMDDVYNQFPLPPGYTY